MQKYTQLSLENRHQIKALLDAGHNQSEIAQTIGFFVDQVPDVPKGQKQQHRAKPYVIKTGLIGKL